MCEECGEAPVQFVAYFNKPGGKHWRPPQRVSASPPSPVSAGGIGGADLSPQSPSKTGVDALMLGRGERAFVCEETRAE